MVAILIIIGIAQIVWTVWNYLKALDLADKEEYLDKYSVHLDERANRLAKWEYELINWDK